MTRAAAAAPAQAAATAIEAPPSRATAPLQRNLLTGPHGLDTRVGPKYTDCTGNTEVAHDAALIDACHTNAVLFVGHNQGVFSPLLNFVVGDVINWYDGTGRLHHLRIIAVRNVSSSVFPPVLGTYEFQTCLYRIPNSPMDRDLDAVEV